MAAGVVEYVLLSKPSVFPERRGVKALGEVLLERALYPHVYRERFEVVQSEEHDAVCDLRPYPLLAHEPRTCADAVAAYQCLKVEASVRDGLRRAGVIHYLGGKTEFMHRGYMDGVDLAFLFHTSTRTDCDFDCHYGQNGCIAKTVRYEGVAAHAGGSPEKGVNALYAASLGLQGINAIRETLRDDDHIRIHPIMTAGGACVNIIPCEATLESYIRGASFDAILDANRKVDRALAAGALALGAKVSVSDRPGYAPLVNSPELVEAVGEAMRALLGEDRVKITNDWTTGCTDMGDVSCIMPVLHPHIAGAAGKSHGDDYHLVDREMACVNSAKGQLLLMALLLENGAARAKQVVERYHAPYESKAAYFATLDAILRDRELIEYHEDTAQIRL